MPTLISRTRFINVDFDLMDMDAVLDRLREVSRGTALIYVVTPNVDHMVRLEKATPEVQQAYRGADLTVCDSRIVRALASRSGIDLPIVPGSDLTRRILDDVVIPGDIIAVIGGDTALIRELQVRYPALQIVHHEPPMGLMRNVTARAAAAAFAASSGARFTFIAVGSPQQELIAGEMKNSGAAYGAALCIGAALEFVVDRKRRAPVFLQSLGLEWAHRLVSEPRRMWRRYLVEGPRIFVMAARWSRNRRSAT